MGKKNFGMNSGMKVGKKLNKQTKTGNSSHKNLL